MKILFITAHKYLPQMYGGLQTSTDEFCHSLLAKGHTVAVLAGLMPGGLLAIKSRIKMKINRRFTQHQVSRDTHLGYPVWYSWFPWDDVEYVAKKENPDVIVVLAMQPVRMAMAAKTTNTPILLQLMDVQFEKHGGSFQDLGNVPCIANSHFTADKYHGAYGVNSTVIYPFISPKKYQTRTTRENLTFINPVVEKGRDIVLEIARLCPQIPFSFVEGWPLSPEQRRDLVKKISALHNVTLLHPQSDMRNVYGKCKILLAPSVCEEAYGRVATEAQMSGIPVIASTRGGLPEAVGHGGILIDPDAPIDHWVTAVTKLWDDNQYYTDLSAAATAYASRPEIGQSYIFDAMEHALVTVCKKCNV